jgi:hypothetical protein
VPAWLPARIWALIRQTPPVQTGLSHWSSQAMAGHLKRIERVSVSWHDVAKRWRNNDLQPHGLVLSADSRTGETQVHAELADPRWVEPIPGTPCHLGDGRVLVGGELAHDGYDARCLLADGTLLTPWTSTVGRGTRLADDPPAGPDEAPPLLLIHSMADDRVRAATDACSSVWRRTAASRPVPSLDHRTGSFRGVASGVIGLRWHLPRLRRLQ